MEKIKVLNFHVNGVQGDGVLKIEGLPCEIAFFVNTFHDTTWINPETGQEEKSPWVYLSLSDHDFDLTEIKCQYSKEVKEQQEKRIQKGMDEYAEEYDKDRIHPVAQRLNLPVTPTREEWLKNAEEALRIGKYWSQHHPCIRFSKGEGKYQDEFTISFKYGGPSRKYFVLSSNKLGTLARSIYAETIIKAFKKAIKE